MTRTTMKRTSSSPPSSRKKKVMKQLIDMIKADFQEEGFTKWEIIKYGVLFPIAFLILYAIVGTLEYNGF